jgi:hypothetical protein
MSYKVSAADLTNIRLNEQDTVTSVLQNIAVILSTRKGTVPMYRGFGLDQRSVDKPIPVAKPMLYIDVKEAIEEYEPRAEVVNVTFQEDPAIPGRLIPTVEVEIIER